MCFVYVHLLCLTLRVPRGADPFTCPRDYILELNLDRLNYKVDLGRQIDIIPRVDIGEATYTFVGKGPGTTFPSIHSACFQGSPSL